MRRVIGNKMLTPQRRKIKFDPKRFRLRLQEHHFDSYQCISADDVNPLYYNVEMPGADARILGCIEGTYTSANSVMATLEDYEPQAVILGERNYFDYIKLVENRSAFETLPEIFDAPEFIVAKEKYTSYFENEMHRKPLYFPFKDDRMIYKADMADKVMAFDDYLTAAYYSIEDPDMRLFFGKPDTTLLLEDLALRFDLQTLRDMFDDCVSDISARITEEEWPPLAGKAHIMHIVKGVSKEKFKDTLFQKSLLYQASMLKKCSRIVKKSYLLTSHLWVEDLENLCLDPLLPEFDVIFRTYAAKHKKKIELELYRKKLQRVLDSNEELKDQDEFKKTTQAKYNFSLTEKPLYDTISKQDPMEILEKYVILCYLVDSDLRSYLKADNNPFDCTIYKSLFEERFTDTAEIYKEFKKLDKTYQDKLHLLENTEIKRLKDFTGFSDRAYMLTYNEQMDKIKTTLREDGYDFKINLQKLLKTEYLLNSMLVEQIERNIRKRISSGMNQTEELIKLQQFAKKEFTSENLALIKRLIAEANSQLNLAKLPRSFHDQAPFTADYIRNELDEKLGPILDKHVQQYLERTEEEDIDYTISDSKVVPIKKGAGGLLPRASYSEEAARKIQEEVEKIYKTQEGQINSQRGTSINDLIKKSLMLKGKKEELAMRMVLGGDDNMMPEELQNAGFEDILKKGGEVLEEFEIKLFEGGKMSEIPAEKRERIEKLLKAVGADKGKNTVIDNWEEEDDHQSKDTNKDKTQLNNSKNLRSRRRNP